MLKGCAKKSIQQHIAIFIFMISVLYCDPCIVIHISWSPCQYPALKCLIFLCVCVCVRVRERVLWVDAPQPISSMLGGDGDAGEGWEDLLLCIQNANLLQVFLAALPGHACAPLQEAPLYLCVCVTEEETEGARGRASFFLATASVAGLYHLHNPLKSCQVICIFR